MRRTLKSVMGVTLLLACFLGSHPLQAQQLVNDQAKILSATAVEQITGTLADIQKKTGKTVMIETVSSLNGVQMDQELKQRFQAKRLNGVLILISMGDHKIGVRAGRQTGLLFKKENQNFLIDTMKPDFKKGNFDGGVLKAVNYMKEVFDRAPVDRRSSSARRSSPFGSSRPYPASRPSGGLGFGGWIVVLLIVLFVYYIFKGIFTAMMGRQGAGTGPMGAQGNAGGGGGGWGGGLLSGILGGFAGAWLGNSLYGMFSGSRGDYGYTDSGDSGGGDGAPAWTGDDAGVSDSGTSSDWSSDDSGGGDVGGGDSSGGDW